MSLTVKNGVCWDVMPFDSCKNQHLCSTKMSVLTRATQLHIPENEIFQVLA
jgi:hypothetical protein